MKKQGSVLILSIWALSFLAVFASYIGLRIRHRASILATVSQNSQLRRIVSSGVKKSISLIRSDFQENFTEVSAERKQFLYNNISRMGKTALGNGHFEIINDNPAYAIQGKVFGVVDEESKLNLNFSDWISIKRLMQFVLDVGDDEASRLADAIIGWREFGSVELSGFYGNEYYSQLKYPYQTKNAEFERLEELKLVKGFGDEKYNKLLPYVTIFGDGQVNINTASSEVLLALGMDLITVEKILEVRRGEDGLEGTLDDFIFQRVFDVASDIASRIDITAEEMKQIDFINSLDLLKIDSYFYSILCKASSGKDGMIYYARVVYGVLENQIMYWREK